MNSRTARIFPRLTPGQRQGMMSVGLGLALGILSPADAGDAVSGGGYTLVGGPVTGGGVASGAGMTLDAAAGDVASGTSRGGVLELSGSLYSVTATAGDFTLTLRDPGNGTIELEWSTEAEAVGYVLETAPALGDPTRWQPVLPVPVPAAHRLTLPLDPARRFYRLRRP